MPRPRFSLRSLLLLVLTLAAAAALWRNWGPWRIERQFGGLAQGLDNLSLSADGKWIIASVDVKHPTDRELNHFYKRNLLWNVQTGECTVLNECSLNHGPWFSADAKWLITGFTAGTPSVLNLLNLQTRAELRLPSNGAYLMTTFSPDNRHALTEVYDEYIRVIDLQSGVEKFKLPYSASLFSRNGTQLAVIHPDGSILILETATGRELKRIPRPTDWDYFQLRYFSESLLIVQALQTEQSWEAFDRGVSLCFEAASPERFDVMRGELLTVSHDESRAVFNENGECRVADLVARKVLSRLEQSTGELSFIENRTRLFDRMNLTVSDADTGKTIYKSEGSQFGALAPDLSRFVATDFNSNSVRIHDTKSGECLATLPSERCFYYQQSFSPTSESFISQNHDTHAIHLWTRHRPERWYGLAWLPEFWLTLVLFTALTFSLRRDWRDRRSTRESEASHAP